MHAVAITSISLVITGHKRAKIQSIFTYEGVLTVTTGVNTSTFTKGSSLMFRLPLMFSFRPRNLLLNLFLIRASAWVLYHVQRAAVRGTRPQLA